MKVAANLVDGVLVIDKPQGLTSHDVVAAARRLLGERRIGHTGTLDPLATGVLPLACGRATRLVRFLTASDKEYQATIRFGVTTDSYDITGSETSRSGAAPDTNAVARGIAALTGGYLQTPPAFSAKKVGGRRAYEMARSATAVKLTPVPVTVHSARLESLEGHLARVRLTCSAGFYVRTFAHSLGELVGTGGCLEALRRVRSGEFESGQAIAMDQLATGGAGNAIIPLDRLLQALPAVPIAENERARVSHGQEVEGVPAAEWVRLVDDSGHLLAMARAGSRPGLLHPAVVLV